MRTPVPRLAGLALVISVSTLTAAAQEKPLPPPDRVPHLVLAHPGPHAPVTALAFAPDASTLYVAGFDKQVRRYRLVNGKYEPAESFRVPIGPGNAGVVNALAVSPDGKWVAVAGRAPIRGESWGTADDGIDDDSGTLPPLLRRDAGVVYLFDPAKPDGGKVIRGQQSEVRALAFANPAPAGGPVLVTAGIERDAENGTASGVVRAFNVNTERQIGSQSGLPTSNVPPGLAAWATGVDKTGLRVAVNWNAGNREVGKLLLWNPLEAKGAGAEWPLDAAYNSLLTVRRDKDGAVAEVVTGGYLISEGQGGLLVRSGAGGKARPEPLDAPKGQLLLPVGIAALNVKGVGESTAVLTRVGMKADERRHELRLLAPTGGSAVALAGVAVSGSPVLAASPDGRFVAVAGFTDNRVEVYAAAALVAGKAVPQPLNGGAVGFSKVAFLVGEKLWLGRAADTLVKGGIVLDLDRAVRAAAPVPKALLDVDAPIQGATVEQMKPDLAKGLPARAAVTLGGIRKELALLDGEQITAAAVLPGRPAWDPNRGAVVAVAHIHDWSRTVQVTLYDHATAKPVLRLGGPTLPVRSLAFSGTRALLAGAGDDGTVVVWSLKNLSGPVPVIAGLVIAGGTVEVTVAGVVPDSPAQKAGLKDGDVIESVADAKGVQKPVTTPIDLQVAVRTLKPGSDAQVKVKGKPRVAVAVGTAPGGRLPLFTLWVDPEAKGGKHDWVGWTSSGPYDANGEAAEGRIWWLTATGDPARPVSFAGANQYRKLFYQRDFIRRLVEFADHRLAERAPPPRPAALVLTPAAPARAGDGPLVVRGALDALDVSLNDPDSTLDLDRAELRWQVTGPAGASDPARVPFSAGRGTLDLSKHSWGRGEHTVQARLFTSPAATVPLLETALVVQVRFPSPVLAVMIDGKAPAVGAEVTTENDEVEVTATADAKADPDGAAVALSWTDGGKPVELARQPRGTYGPLKVKLKADGPTVVRVTATNRGAGAATDETTTVEVRVRKLTKPTIRLEVLTPYDFRKATDEPYVVSTEKATVTATVDFAPALGKLEWKVGDGPWTDGTIDAKSKSEMRELPLPAGNAALAVQVRATLANTAAATDAVRIVYEEVPAVSVTLPPAVVTAPELNLSGGLKVRGKRPFKVRVLVTSSRTGRTREFEPMVNAGLTQWDAGITLFPGENKLGYVVKYDEDRKELRREGLIDVRYVRAPLVAGAAPVDVGTGTVGDLALAVVAPPDAPPTQLTVNGTPVGFATHAKPLTAFGFKLWVLTARGVAVPAGADRLKPLAVAVRNAERESGPVAVPVAGRVEEVKPPPPQVLVTRNGGILAADRPPVTVGQGRFEFELKVTSEDRPTRVEVWFGPADGTGVLLEAVTAADAVPAPGGGFVLTAKPVLTLRPGSSNHVRVVASGAGGTTTGGFQVSYAPPPARVVIDSIAEPGGNALPVVPGSAADLKVKGHTIDVEGRVLWDYDDAPVATDRNLDVVLTANGVAHLPVTVAPAKPGSADRERKFKGRVYLNAVGAADPAAAGTTNVRAELRSGSRPVPLPQEGLTQAGFAVTSAAPLREQRLHVLVLGVQVPDADRKPLVRNVVAALGGTVPADAPNFTEGRFEHPRFRFAYLYSPRLGYTKGGDLNALLIAVRADIEWRSKRAGEEWVNDVVLVYYEGEDWRDKDTGRRYLHSATTLSGAAGKNPADYAIRLDNLPAVPGARAGFGNVFGGEEEVGPALTNDIIYLRYAWKDPADLALLLPEFAKAVRRESEVGRILVAAHAGMPRASKPVLGDLEREYILRRLLGLPDREKP